MDIITSYGIILILTAAVVGFFMAYGIGANDVANAMGTSVGSKAITIKQAILIAMVFEFAGAYFAGGEVTSTIRKGIIDSTPFINHPDLFIIGMISALFAAGLWLLIASWFGWPVSTTHSILGAIIGFAVVSVGTEAIQWIKVGGIIGSWVITPLLASFIAYIIIKSTQKLIFDTEIPLINAKKYVPIYMALAGFIVTLVTIKKGIKHIGIEMGNTEGYLLSAFIALAIFIAGKIAISRLQININTTKQIQFDNIEKIFAILMVLTACCMAFAHGSNDVANAIGPLAAVVNVIQNEGELLKNSVIVWWILPLGGLGIVAGLALLGRRVIKTIGEGITHLTPSKGFAAELAAASTVVIASGSGLPISTTQTLVGGVLGVGIACSFNTLNYKVIRSIVISWIVTLPMGAFICILVFYLLRAYFNI